MGDIKYHVAINSKWAKKVNYLLASKGVVSNKAGRLLLNTA